MRLLTWNQIFAFLLLLLLSQNLGWGLVPVRSCFRTRHSNIEKCSGPPEAVHREVSAERLWLILLAVVASYLSKGLIVGYREFIMNRGLRKAVRQSAPTVSTISLWRWEMRPSEALVASVTVCGHVLGFQSKSWPERISELFCGEFGAIKLVGHVSEPRSVLLIALHSPFGSR